MLASQNGQGSSVPDETHMGTLGNEYSYACAFPEAEEPSPWQRGHVQKRIQTGRHHRQRIAKRIQDDRGSLGVAK